MVTMDQVHEIMRKSFRGIQEQEVHDDLTVSIKCKALHYRLPKLQELPVTFRHIQGNVYLRDLGLTTLKGLPDHIQGSLNVSNNQLHTLLHAPRRVEDDFNCSNNKLTSLKHGPEYVGGAYMANADGLQELKGMASHIGVFVGVDYNEHMGLLRCLVADTIFVDFAPDELKDILYKYKGEGRPGAIKCAVELIRAGYKENARW